MSEQLSFSFRFGALSPLLALAGMGPSHSYLRIGDGQLQVHFGWAFHASIPLSSIKAVRTEDTFVGGIGVHGLAGRWLVNGSVSGIVSMDIEPPTRAIAMLFT